MSTGTNRLGVTAGEWTHFAALGLESDLLPVVVDPAAKWSERSAIKEPGKVPSHFTRGEAHGMKDWPSHVSTAGDIARWSRDGRLGICLIARTVRAIDIDVNDEVIANTIRDFIEMGIGALPCRGRSNSGRKVLAFRMPGEFPKRVFTLKGSTTDKVEFLGTGNQFLISGRHKSGVPYEWDGGLPAEIPELSAEEFEVLWAALVEQFAEPGSATSARKSRAAVKHEPRADASAFRNWLYEHWACGEDASGELEVLCPNDANHSEGGAQWAGYNEAKGFHCFHAGCGHLDLFTFQAAIGYTHAAVLEDFEVVTPMTEEQTAESAAAAIRNVAKHEQRGPVVVVDAASGELLEVVSPAFSDDQLALQFAGRAVAFLRWTPGLGWMAYDGQVWRRDEHLQRFGLARTICRDAARLSDKVAEAKALASSRAVSAVVTLAQSDTRLMVPVAEWDSDPMLLNTPDGVVDLRNGAMEPRRGHLVTRCARVSPSEGAGCPTWLAFLQAAFQSDQEVIAFVQRLLGYTLTGDRREQKLFFFWGEGSNGKSTLADLVLWILGTYALKLSSAVLMQTAHDKHPTELAQLQGIRLAMSSELEEGAFFNEARVKELTGDAVLSARFMRGDFFEFAMQHKHIIVGNHRPRLRGGDPAMARRLVLVPFKAVFPEATQDKALPEKLKAEGPAILAWLIEGAVQWGANGLGAPDSVLSASAEYLANHDDVQQWLDDRCHLSAGVSTRAGVLYSDFVVWKLARGEKAPSITVWGERMALKPGIEKKRSGGIVYAGASLKPQATMSIEEFA